MKKTIEELINDAGGDARHIIFKILDEENYIKSMENIILFNDIIDNSDRIKKLLEKRAEHLRRTL